MENNKIQYRKASIKDLDSITKTQEICFPDAFFTSLGPVLINEFYKEFIHGDNLFWIAEDNGKMIGFCVGYVLGSQAKVKFIKKNRIRLILRMLFLDICLDRQALTRTFDLVKPFFKKNKVCQADCNQITLKGANLMSICVFEEYRGGGVSMILVERFENELKEKNVDYYKLSVLKENIRAIKFYEKCGLIIDRVNSMELVMIKKI